MQHNSKTRRHTPLAKCVISCLFLAGMATVSGLSGCKPPTFQELIGADGGGDDKQQAQPLPVPAKPLPSPKEIVGEFQERDTKTTTDDDLARLSQIRGSIEQLTALDLSDSKITARGLQIVSKFPAVSELNLAGVTISKAGLTALLKLSQIEKLSVARTGLAEDDLAQLQMLPNLKDLDVGGNQLTDASLAIFRDFPALEVLRVPGNAIDGSGFAVFADPNGANTLKGIDASETAFVEQGFEQIADMESLELLEISRAGITDGDLAVLKGFDDLRELNLSHNAITDLGIGQLKNCKNLAFLNLEGTYCSLKAAEVMRKLIPGLVVRIDGRTLDGDLQNLDTSKSKDEGDVSAEDIRNSGLGSVPSSRSRSAGPSRSRPARSRPIRRPPSRSRSGSR